MVTADAQRAEDDAIATAPAFARDNQTPPKFSSGTAGSAPPPPVVEAEGRAAPATGGGSERAAVVTTWLFRRDEAPRAFELVDLPRLAETDDNLAWADFSGYTEGDLRAVAELLGLRVRSVQAALSPWRRPRIESYGDYFFVAVTVTHATGGYRVQAHELDLFVGRNFVVSAHKVDVPFLAGVAERARETPQLMQHHSAFLLYIVLDELLGDYERQFEHLEDEIERMEERALHETSDAFLVDFLHLKRYVFAQGRLAEQHRAVFAAFGRPDFRYVAGEEVEPYFKDLEDRLARVLGRLFAARDAVAGAFDLFVSHVAHRTNAVMKLLAVVSTVLLPATVIVGFFGTSFEGIPGLHSPTAFLAMLGSLVLVPAVTLLLFRRQGWI